MHTTVLAEIAAQRAADLHREAARQRLLLELRASRKPTVRRRRIWARLFVRRPRPAVVVATAPPDPSRQAMASGPAVARRRPAVARARIAVPVESGRREGASNGAAQ
jgi:hypothetical protein